MIKTVLIIFIPLYTAFFLSGCTANLGDPDISFEPPTYVEQMPARENQQDFVSTGSIFGQGDNPLFSDHKAMHVHDIVTVVISETTKSSNSAAKSFGKTDSSSLGGGAFTTAGASSPYARISSTVNGLANIGFKSDSTNAFTGNGSATKDASFTTTVSARVVKILQNGNYFIVGKREILIDNQKQIIQISGVIRPYDIDQNNNINSAQMSEAKILYKTEGEIDNATKQGWGSKIIQSVWPF